MQFTDRLTLDGGLRRTSDGYAVTSARVARANNVQLYTGAELGKPEMKTVRVFRPEAEVFDRAAIASYAGVPVTMGHPAGGVSSDTWKDVAVGEADSEVVRDGEFVRIPIMLRDAKAIKAVEDGRRELSMGYSAELVWQDGKTPSGEPYDALQTRLRMNHVAIVDQARGGHELRIGDGAGQWGAAPILPTIDKETITMSDALRTVVVDGLSVQTTDQGAQAIDKLQKALADAKSTADTTIQAKDGELAGLRKQVETKDGEIAALTKQVEDAKMKPADLAKLVKDRALLVSDAKKIGVDDKAMDDMTEEEIKRKAVAKKMGDETAKAMTADAINGAFAVLVKANDGVNDALRNVMKDGVTVQMGDRDTAYKEYLDSLKNGYKGQKEAR